VKIGIAKYQSGSFFVNVRNQEPARENAYTSQPSVFVHHSRLDIQSQQSPERPNLLKILKTPEKNAD
jgi:hypothetical protein